MLASFPQSPRNNTHPLGSLLKSTALLRIGAGIVLLTTRSWEAAVAAFHFFWRETPWPWVPLFEKHGVPLPHLAAPLAALALFAVSLSWISGFLTRFAAALLIVLCSLAMAFGPDSVHAELCWLYRLIAAALLMYGSGSISLDRLFHLGAGWKKSPPNHY